MSTVQSANDGLEALVRRLPKAEMHLHLCGAFRWETVRELHPRGAAFPPAPPWLEDGHSFADFKDFIEIFQTYLRPATGTREAIARHTREVLLDLAEQNVRYAELSVGPGFHTAQGLELEAVLEAMRQGQQEAEAATRLRARFFLGLNRHLDSDYVIRNAYRMLDFAGPLGTGFLSGVDLQGDERTSTPVVYEELFAHARKRGLRVRVHAGELCGPEKVWEAIERFGVAHISHGVRAIEDAGLVRELAKRGVVLHVCPTSNLRLGVAASYAAHPLKRLIEAGCKVTIGSDDPALFGASVSAEYLNAIRHMGLSVDQLVAAIRTAFESSLLPEAERAALLAELEAARAG